MYQIVITKTYQLQQEQQPLVEQEEPLEILVEAFLDALGASLVYHPMEASYPVETLVASSYQASFQVESQALEVLGHQKEKMAAFLLVQVVVEDAQVEEQILVVAFHNRFENGMFCGFVCVWLSEHSRIFGFPSGLRNPKICLHQSSAVRTTWE